MHSGQTPDRNRKLLHHKVSGFAKNQIQPVLDKTDIVFTVGLALHL